MKRKGRAPDDRVTPELARYLFAREGGCLVAILMIRGEIADQGPCAGRDGRLWPISTALEAHLWPAVLTVAHVRDSRGGRGGKRPPSTPRRTAAVCAGHALPPRNVADRADVRPAIDRYLEAREGRDVDDSRPWEAIRRVRASGDAARLAPVEPEIPAPARHSDEEGGRA